MASQSYTFTLPFRGKTFAGVEPSAPVYEADLRYGSGPPNDPFHVAEKIVPGWTVAGFPPSVLADSIPASITVVISGDPAVLYLDDFDIVVSYGDHYGLLAAYTTRIYGGLGVSGSPPPPAATPVLTGFLAQDAHRRPLAALADPAAKSGALGCYSNDAGHSFERAVIDPDPTCTDISLLVDQKLNHFGVLYSKGAPDKTALYCAFGSIEDSFTPAAAPGAASGVSGAFAIAAPHPTDREFALLLLLSSGTLSAAQSGDYGRTWTMGGVVAGGVDFSASGRPGLAWLGETAFALYASAKTLLCAQSPDRGLTWTAATTVPAAVASAGPYSGVSLLGWQGTLYALAFHSPKADAPPVPVLLRSGGEPWAAAGGVLPAIAPPSAIGVLPETSLLRLGMEYHSTDDGQTWLAN